MSENAGKVKVLVITFQEGTSLTAPKTEILGIDEFDEKRKDMNVISFDPKERLEFIKNIAEKIKHQEIAYEVSLGIMSLLNSMASNKNDMGV